MATCSPWFSRRRLALLGSLVGAILAAAPPAIGTGLSCPTDHGGSRLVHYGIFDGDPAREVQQAPYNEGDPRAAYDVRRSTSDDPRLGYALVCDYARGDRVTMAIPAAMKHCEAAGSDFRPNVLCR